MTQSKAWDWSKNQSNDRLIPSIEACYLAESWKSKGFGRLLDLGCGLGRHAIYFGKKGFKVNVLDLSEHGINYLKKWAEQEKADVTTDVCDVPDLPFERDTFDCIIAYNTIYRTDINGFIRSLDEIKRVLKRGGELFVTLLSKDTCPYQETGNYEQMEHSTVLRNEHDAEKDIPHFYVNIEDMKRYFTGFEFDSEFITPPVERTIYKVGNIECFYKHFNLILRNK